MTYNVHADGFLAVSMQHDMRLGFCRQVTKHGPSPCNKARSLLRLHVTCTARDGSNPFTSWVYKGQDLDS